MVLIAPSFPGRTNRELDNNEIEEDDKEGVQGWDKAAIKTRGWNNSADAGGKTASWDNNTTATKTPESQKADIWNKDAVETEDKDNDDDSLYRDDGKDERGTDKYNDNAENDINRFDPREYPVVFSTEGPPIDEQ